MTKKRAGTRLELALRESWPRWGYFSFVFFWTCVLLAPLAYFLLELRKNPGPKDIGCFTVVMGILGLFALVDLARTTILWAFVGDTIVEITRRPPAIGTHLDYFILQARAPAGTRSFEAWLQLRRSYRRTTSIDLSVPLAPAVLEPDGRRRIEGTLVMPDLPPAQGHLIPRNPQWLIQVRIRFKGGFTHEEEHPFVVE